jgi:hypothetical protein
MLDEEYKPRFIFEITEEQKNRAAKLISQYGLRKAIFQPILNDVLDMIEEHGGIAIGVLMSGTVKPREIIRSMKQASLAGDKQDEH